MNDELEASARAYSPCPVDVSLVQLSPWLESRVDMLARKHHARWMDLRQAEGWSWGPAFDASMRRHALLLPFDDLPAEDRESNRVQAREFLCTLVVLGWIPGLTVRDQGPAWTDALARNHHDVWARARFDEGWTWGRVRDDAAKRHPLLVPYEHLSEAEREMDRAGVRAYLAALMVAVD